ncbi:MAG: Rieske 2Fe-2S domain-containing protein [Candidatus Thermoplasmatota archaeon]|nr:Rieske 2Fe-2S domain-containing protein [Candidatus Thermoplasmatota archaeon]
MPELARMCHVDDLQDGGMIKSEVLGCEYLVIKLAEDIYVLDASCTLEWTDLSKGSLEGEIVTCPVCKGQFNIRSGDVAREPPTFPLDTYNVKVVDGTVYGEVSGY